MRITPDSSGKTEDTYEIERVSDLWFEDGGLVIQADQCYFKIFKGMLTARSSVFKTILDEGPTTTKRCVDGCHLLQVSDSAADMTYFLKAIFDSGCAPNLRLDFSSTHAPLGRFFEPAPAPTDFRIISGVLRLSHKYDVQYLRRRALAHLSSAYPATFAAYQNREDGAPTRSNRSFPEPTSPSDHFGILRLAKEVGVLWVLPTEVYHCCQYEPAIILDKAGPDWASVVLAASTRLRSKHLFLLHHLATPLSGNNGCSTYSKCALARVRLFMTRAAHHEADPLAPVTDAEWDFLSEETCDQCLADAKNLFREWRLSIWEDIPEMLDLPTWEELEQLKAEDLVPQVGVPVNLNMVRSSSPDLSQDVQSQLHYTSESDDETISIGLY